MPLERTLSIIKPDAFKKNLVGEVISRFERAGLKIKALKMIRLSKEEAMGFYHVHRGKPFYAALTDFMSSGPCVPMVIEGEDAIAKVREIMGATDPQKAKKGTIRSDFGQSIERNAVHGSDAPETARFEINFFFPGEL